MEIKVHPNKTMFLVMGIGEGTCETGPHKGEKFSICTHTTNGMPVILYRNRYANHAHTVHDFVDACVKAIDAELDGKKKPRRKK